MEIKINCRYQYKNRAVVVVQYSEKRGRVEVINFGDKYNPYWINSDELNIMKIKDLTKEQAIEIVKLAFYDPNWIKTDFDFLYQPYIPEHYEDAREYIFLTFEAYFVGDKTTKYKVEISPELNVWMWHLENDTYHTMGIHNQRLIQQKFTEFGF